MKQNKLSKLENNYYYGVSRVFWHIIISLGTLAIIAGIGVLIWSQIPPTEKKVTKQSAPLKQIYPEPVAVTLTEIQNSLPKGKDLTKLKNKITQVEIINNDAPENNDISTRDTLGLSQFNKQVHLLKTLVPIAENYKLWNKQGFYQYSNERMYKRTKNEKYRRFVTTSNGFEQEFINETDNKRLKKYLDKALLLSVYNSLLENINKESRSNILTQQLLNFYTTKNGLQTSINKINSISSIIKFIDSQEQENAFKVLNQFLLYNPKDGIGLQTYQLNVLGYFEPSQRLNAIKTINNEYTINYNNRLAAIIENTKQFTPLLTNFVGDQQPVALKNFYNLYRNKNGNRDEQIQAIENQYIQNLKNVDLNYTKKLAQAKATFLLNKSKKETMKWLSFKSMAIGLGVVLLISLILLILSMIRNVNRLTEVMLENNNKTL